MFRKLEGGTREGTQAVSSFGFAPGDILRRRAEDKDPITRHIEVSPSNPIHLAPTIAMKRAPSTEELVKAKLSRFQTQKKPE